MAAINEISARVHESSEISQHAVAQTREAHDIVRNLSNASAEIGKVVSLIQAIAAQTQSARAQCHDRGGARRRIRKRVRGCRDRSENARQPDREGNGRDRKPHQRRRGSDRKSGERDRQC